MTETREDFDRFLGSAPIEQERGQGETGVEVGGLISQQLGQGRLGPVEVAGVGQTPRPPSTASSTTGGVNWEMNWRTAASGTAPVNWLTGLPSLKAITIGIPWTPKAWASRGLASTSTLAKPYGALGLVGHLFEDRAERLAGWHQSAQKSTTTGACLEPSITTVWKSASETSVTYVVIAI